MKGTEDRLSAASIICAHNHPSGSSIESPEDIHVTKRLVEVGQTLGVPVRDHIIIGQGCFVSMREKMYYLWN
ncbi:JAB domain-containing protein [Anoxybacteroides tepidamans]|uniref:JAB domain-containing protein n=1 Tax=Anoxybacteroides tepidamans TaxID=265948 RepID=UPI0009FB9EC8|nr:JAB domain-containing protein [Anoxybacillus tepidamans]